MMLRQRLLNPMQEESKAEQLQQFKEQSLSLAVLQIALNLDRNLSNRNILQLLTGLENRLKTTIVKFQ